MGKPNFRVMNIRLGESSQINRGLCDGQDHPCSKHPQNIHQIGSCVPSDTILVWASIKINPAVPRTADTQEHGIADDINKKCQSREFRKEGDRSREVWWTIPTTTKLPTQCSILPRRIELVTSLCLWWWQNYYRKVYTRLWDSNIAINTLSLLHC